MADDPWAFGWDQIIAATEVVVIGLAAVMAYKAAVQFRREKVETRQAELAEEALSLAYKATDVFRSIRSPFQQIPQDKLGDKAYVYKQKLEIIEEFKSYFDSLIEIRPKLKAVFGPSIEDQMVKIIMIRNEIGYGCSDMIQNEFDFEGGADLRKQARSVIFGRQGDEVDGRVSSIVSELERQFKPILAHRYRK